MGPVQIGKCNKAEVNRYKKEIATHAFSG